MNLLHRLLPGIALVIGAFVLSAGLQTLAAWTPPSGSPPSSNATAPLNTGSGTQTKSGGLNITGSVGIGTANPTQKLDVSGYVRGSSGLCIRNDCRAAWPSPGTGTVTSVATNNGLIGGTITTSGTLGLNITGISTCTNSTSQKIYWNGSYLACGTDQIGGLSGGSTNYIPKWTSGTTISGTSNIYDNGTNVGIGTANPTQKLDVSGYVRGSSGLCIGNDCRAAWPISSTGDITAVLPGAGSGLSGGGYSGDVTLSLAQSCLPGQFLRGIGTSYSCAAPSAAPPPPSPQPTISSQAICYRPKTAGSGTTWCTASNNADVCFLNGSGADDPVSGDVNGFDCVTIGTLNGVWQVYAWSDGGQDVTCRATCLSW